MDEGGGSGGHEEDQAEETGLLPDREAQLQAIQFSPQKPGWHDYTEGPTIVCRAELQCSDQDMANYLSRFAVPGQDPNAPARDGERYLGSVA